jgi:hypothetical protein
LTKIVRRIDAGPANPRRRCFAIALMLAACTPEGSLGRDGATDSGSGEGTTTGGDTTSSSSEASGDHDGSGSSETSSSSGEGSSDSGSSSGLASCEPVGDETACMVCLLSHCCDTQQACAVDEQCACVLDCVEQGGAGTVETCTTSHCPDSADAFMPELECAHAQCMDACPWAS